MPMVLGTLSVGIAGGAVALWGMALMILIFVLHADVILKITFGARSIDSAASPELVRLAADVAARAELGKPRLGLINSRQPNAFAVTHGQMEKSTILLTEALLRELNRAEIEAVLTLLMVQLRRHDAYSMQVLASLGSMGSIALNGALLRQAGSPDVVPGAFARILALFEAPVSRLAERFVLRSQDKIELVYAADADAAELCGNPLFLARTLARLDGLAATVQNHTVERHPATAHMFVVDPRQEAHAGGVSTTHPPMRARVERLRQMAGVGVDF
ncbi:MAG: M48 family metalloprotease [Mangrovicoccus sp.]|nr:M48 family metalloprotease [Mangrovicoccus sp.]